MAKTKRIGILTSGGDSPGLNAAIRGVGKAAIGFYGMDLIGFRDGFRGLALDHRMKLEKTTLAGILTVGGTILGTSRDKPHRIEMDGRHAGHDRGDRQELPEARAGRAGLPGRRRHAEKCAAPGTEPGCNVHHPAQRPSTTTWP